jgi:hypothetical protein
MYDISVKFIKLVGILSSQMVYDILAGCSLIYLYLCYVTMTFNLHVISYSMHLITKVPILINKFYVCS